MRTTTDRPAGHAPGTVTDLDGLHDPQQWTGLAIEEGLGAWQRRGLRYAARLAAQAHLRDPVEDVLTLAARRAVPLPRRVLRPLPVSAGGAGAEPAARAFARLPLADRRVLLQWKAEAPLRGAAGEHLAAALGRLADTLLEVRAEPDLNQ